MDGCSSRGDAAAWLVFWPAGRWLWWLWLWCFEEELVEVVCKLNAKQRNDNASEADVQPLSGAQVLVALDEGARVVECHSGTEIAGKGESVQLFARSGEVVENRTTR